MITLKEALSDAQRRRIAIGHFNVSDLVALKAVAGAARVLAPAVGNMRGLFESMISGDVRKRLDIGRIAERAVATGKPLTLHGGSGTDDGDFGRQFRPA